MLVSCVRSCESIASRRVRPHNSRRRRRVAASRTRLPARRVRSAPAEVRRRHARLLMLWHFLIETCATKKCNSLYQRRVCTISAFFKVSGGGGEPKVEAEGSYGMDWFVFLARSRASRARLPARRVRLAREEVRLHARLLLF